MKGAGASSKRLQSGNFTIDVLRGHQKKVFRTNPVELKESNLVGAWIYSDGAKPNAQDKLAGLAVEFTRADNYSPSLLILRSYFKRNRNGPAACEDSWNGAAKAGHPPLSLISLVRPNVAFILTINRDNSHDSLVSRWHGLRSDRLANSENGSEKQSHSQK